MLNGEAYTVTGVLPEQYRSIAGAGLAPDVYLPISGDLVPALNARRFIVQLFGRLRDGQGLAAGQAALGAVVARIDHFRRCHEGSCRRVGIPRRVRRSR